MSRRDRQNAILEFLSDAETAQVSELAERFDVSKMTIHRDIDRLVELRLVRKVRGSVTVLPNVVFEANYHFRAQRQCDEKRALAEYIANEIEPGMVLMLDDSTTTAALLEFLPESSPLTVISNARGVINSLVPDNRFNVINLGGYYEPTTDAFLGLTCELSVKQLSADLAIFSVASVQNACAYLQDESLVRAKRAMKRCAARSILAFDPSKCNKSALHRFDDLSAFDRVVTLSSVNQATADALRAADAALETVMPPSNQVAQQKGMSA